MDIMSNLKKLSEIIELAKKFPNDTQFGGKVREIVRNLEVKK